MVYLCDFACWRPPPSHAAPIQRLPWGAEFDAGSSKEVLKKHPAVRKKKCRGFFFGRQKQSKESSFLSFFFQLARILYLQKRQGAGHGDEWQPRAFSIPGVFIVSFFFRKKTGETFFILSPFFFLTTPPPFFPSSNQNPNSMPPNRRDSPPPPPRST